jgi:predicted ATP-dependent endonuclease of OLD family
MHISELTIEGFRSFEKQFKVNFNPGLNVIVGENGTGKTGIISAVRQLFTDSEAGRYSVADQDFHLGFTDKSVRAAQFNISATFSKLDKKEELAFLNWQNEKDLVQLNLHVENREFRGRHKRTLWAGKTKGPVEVDTLDLIRCIYLPPLRDAEDKLSNGTRSRLAKLMKAICKKDLLAHDQAGTQHPLVAKVEKFNNDLADDKDSDIKRANTMIGEALKNSIGENFAQGTRIQFSESDFSRIVEGLRLLYFPDLSAIDAGLFRSLSENSLGFNNLIYMASILAELTLASENRDQDTGYFHLLLIEEPEAHLHPQLQTRLLRYLSQVAENQSVQVVVTTHSTVLASAVPIDAIIHVACAREPVATLLSACGLAEPSRKFVNRWLDVTKSNLLFARGLIFVEGIAEAIVVPELAKLVLKDQAPGKQSLADLGISVINLNGIYFKHFMQFFCNINLDFPTALNVPIRCAGLTDLDPAKTESVLEAGVSVVRDIKPCDGNMHVGTNHALGLVPQIAQSSDARLMVGLYKTFEYDLAMESNNIPAIAKVVLSAWPAATGKKRERLTELSNDAVNWVGEKPEDKAEAAFDLLELIDDDQIGKGLFAQLLADELASGKVVLTTPRYIEDAIHWACKTH